VFSGPVLYDTWWCLFLGKLGQSNTWRSTKRSNITSLCQVGLVHTIFLHTGVCAWCAFKEVGAHSFAANFLIDFDRCAYCRSGDSFGCLISATHHFLKRVLNTRIATSSFGAIDWTGLILASKSALANLLFRPVLRDWVDSGHLFFSWLWCISGPVFCRIGEENGSTHFFGWAFIRSFGSSWPTCTNGSNATPCCGERAPIDSFILFLLVFRDFLLRHLALV